MTDKTELNLTGAKENKCVWLVKVMIFKMFISLTSNPACQQVPRYLSQQWERASDKGEVGTISIAKKQGKPEVRGCMIQCICVWPWC
ncbi:General transcription factor IIF subunit 2 [Takifugu flavidus]|uniref:General transcription factor IIF subunit 2 n=1 Tax=Takifugu flavidus TaxID=433684 RepID=A0A5C6PLK4_9TELE|nr:General transcription factor IIF subunit 2 [Takifugu flavidus]